MPASGPATEEDLRQWIIDWIAEELEVDADTVDPDAPLQEVGLGSRHAVGLIGELEDLLDVSIPTTLAWELPTITLISRHLIALANGEDPTAVPANDDDAAADAAAVPVAGAPAGTDPLHEAIAVVGVGVRLPGGSVDPRTYNELLLGGMDAVGEVPEGRWEQFVDDSARTKELIDGTTRTGGFIGAVDGFDAEFFRITPREAEVMDPQQRILLEVTWEALEHAGIPPQSLRGSRTGVYMGISVSEYSHLTAADLHRIDAWTATGSALSIAANRLSYAFDLRGPSVAVDTACSSSLVALHQAVSGLRAGETSVALAGGVNLMLSPALTVNFDLGNALAADGRCKTFSADADGIARGEGAGVVVLKRLSDAERDGDRILSVIRATGVNSDGRSNGLLAPNPASQEALLRSVYERSGIDPTTVDYVEAHGTGTLLGDPIEAGALGAVLGRRRDPDRPLLIGSVKTNIGHLEPAAGIAGVIKVVLSLAGGRIPASLNFDKPNPHISFDRDRLEVVTTPTAWPHYAPKALAGVSAFGFGGTNAHVVLEEYPATAGTPDVVDLTDPAEGEPAEDQPAQTLLLSGLSADRLRDAAESLAEWLLSPAAATVPTADVAHTLAHHRDLAVTRGAVVGRGRVELSRQLRLLAGGHDAPGVVTGTTPSPTAAAARKGPVWVFSGYGSQWQGMGRRLYADEPVFTAAVDRLDPLFTEQAGFSLRDVIATGAALRGVDDTQVVLFGLQVALAELWRSAGSEPAAVIGHSMGEVAAAVVSGALDVADGLKVMVVRSRLLNGIDSKGAGGMAVVDLSAEEITALADRFPDVHIGVYGSPTQCTVAGEATQIKALVDHVHALGRDAWALKVTGAGHSPAVDPVLPELRAGLAGVKGRTPAVKVYSTVHEDHARVPEFDTDYWAANARQPVRFSQAVAAAAADGHTTFVEISPHPVASFGLRRTLEFIGLPDATVTGTLRRDTDDVVQFRSAVARLACEGREGVLEHLAPEGDLVDLPRMVWRRKRHWVETSPRRGGGTAELDQPLLGTHVDLPEGDRHLWRGDVGSLAVPALADLPLHDLPVLPAAAVTAMALEAAAIAFDVPVESVTLEDLALERPVALTPSLPVTTSVTLLGPSSGAVEVFVAGPPSAGRATWVRHATASATAAVGRTAPRRTTDVATVSVEALQRHLLGLAGDGEGEKPATPIARTPAAISRLRVRGDLEIPATAVVTPAPADEAALEVRGDVRLLTSSGTELLTAEGVVLRGLGRADVPVTLADKAFEARWEPSPLPVQAPEAEDPGRWLLVLADSSDALAPATGRLLTEAGHTVVTVTGSGPSLRQQVLEALVPFRDEGAELSGVVVVPAAGRALPSALEDGFVEAAATATVDSLATARAVVESELPGSPRLWVVTRGGASLQESEAGDPSSAALRGLIRTLGFEHSELGATLVDLDAAGDAADAAGTLRTELLAALPHDEVAWRARTRFAARLARAEVVPATETPAGFAVVGSGAYVITGGLGGLGLVVAQWLAERGASRIVLSGRRAPSEGASVVLDGLRNRGVDVRTVRGDIAVPGVARDLVTEATLDGVPLRGVVHAAGVLRDEMALDVEAEHLHQVWSPKVRGGWLLHEATADVADLDWFVMFSSAAALIGSPGQSSYASANAWLDALVHIRRAAGLPATTVNWGAWSEVGGAKSLENPLLEPMSPPEGLEALDAVLASRRAGAGVVRLDPRRVLQLFPGLADQAFFATLLEEARSEGGLEEDDWGGPEAVLAAGTGGQAMLSRRLRDRLAGIMGMEGGSVADDVPLVQMGLDSLMAARARSAVEHDLGLTLPTRLLLQGATVSDIETYLMGELGLSGESGPVPASSGGAAASSSNGHGPNSVTATDGKPANSAAYSLGTAGNGSGNGSINGLTMPVLPDDYVAPRDPTERWLARIWQDVLDLPRIGVTDDFYALGGDQEAALRVADRIADRLLDNLGMSLGAPVLFAEPTLEQMADLLREALEGNGGSPIRVLRRSGAWTPLFLFHPAGGPTSVYEPLVSMLPSAQPVYGLERIEEIDDIEGKAARYIELIKELRPEGPYRLGGWSFGGMLALETARQLAAVGDEVEFVMLIDTIIPLPADGLSRQELLMGRFGKFADYLQDTYGRQMDIPYDQLADLDERQQIEMLTTVLTSAELGLPAGVIEHQRTSYTDGRVLEHYTPQSYDGRVVLYRATDPEPIAARIDPRYARTELDAGWAPLLSNLEIHKVPGHHISMIDPPHVNVVAEHLSTSLQNLRTNVRARS